MNHSENCEPRSRKNRLVIGVSVLLLALAVFGWGLHSKLSLYHVRAHASPSAPIAKLLSERERPAAPAHHGQIDHIDLRVVAFSAGTFFIPLSHNGVRGKQTYEDATPLSLRTITYQGPSLRRPPPSPVA